MRKLLAFALIATGLTSCRKSLPDVDMTRQDRVLGLDIESQDQEAFQDYVKRHPNLQIVVVVPEADGVRPYIIKPGATAIDLGIRNALAFAYQKSRDTVTLLAGPDTGYDPAKVETMHLKCSDEGNRRSLCKITSDDPLRNGPQ